ncbi:hypothetical protein BN903_233 [Halorubrum sp. AJ67]|nr:hypothetical protein BN903_233 [Halorubrum sp. AJ67]
MVFVANPAVTAYNRAVAARLSVTKSSTKSGSATPYSAYRKRVGGARLRPGFPYTRFHALAQPRT